MHPFVILDADLVGARVKQMDKNYRSGTVIVAECQPYLDATGSSTERTKPTIYHIGARSPEATEDGCKPT